NEEGDGESRAALFGARTGEVFEVEPSALFAKDDNDASTAVSLGEASDLVGKRSLGDGEDGAVIGVLHSRLDLIQGRFLLWTLL
ncbi:15597_t:CDS:2, partial [Acaulospora colombiana]